MSRLGLLRTLVTERLTAAVEEILELVERAMAEQEAELIRQYRPAEEERSPGRDAHTDAQWFDGADLQQQVKEEQLEIPVIKQEEEEKEGEVWSAPPVQDEAPQMAVEQDIKVLVSSVEGQVESAPCEVALKEEPKDSDAVPNTSSELTDDPALHPNPLRDTYSSRTSCSCKVCGMLFSYRSLSSLMKHAEIHADDERCLCGVCGKLLPGRKNLLQHLQTHMKIHVCHVCFKTFQKHSELVTHTCSHTVKKPLRGNKYGRKCKRMHTEEKMYCCSVCGRSFSLSSSLIRHSRVHKHTKHSARGASATATSCDDT